MMVRVVACSTDLVTTLCPLMNLGWVGEGDGEGDRLG